jgi:hypothetical protein
MEHRVLLVAIERRLGRDELADLNPLESPPVGFGNRPEFLLGFRKGDVQNGFAVSGSRSQVLQR